MLIQLKDNITSDDKNQIIDKMAGLKYKSTEVKTQKGNYLVGIGKKDFDIRDVGHMPGIADIHIVSDDYKLVSRKWKVKPTVIDLGDGVTIEEGGMALMAGPCSIESEEQIEKTIAHLIENNIDRKSVV